MKAITRQTYLLFWQHMRRYRGRFWIIITAIILGSLADITTPLFYKQFVNVLSVSHLGNQADFHKLLGILLVILAINLLAWLFYRIATFVNNYFQPKVMADLQDTCFNYLHGHSFGFFVNRFVGGLVRKVGRLIRGFEDITDAWYWNILRITISLLAVLVVIFINYWRVGLIMAIWLVAYLFINYALTLRKLKLDEAAAQVDTEVTSYLADTITNQANLKIFTSVGEEAESFANVTNKQFKISKRSWDFDATIEAVQAFFMVALEFMVFYYGLTLWFKSLVTVGDFILVQAYITQVFSQLWGFGRIIRRTYRSLADAEEMVEILNTPHSVVDKQPRRELIVTRGQVEFRNISFNYGSSSEVIKNFSLLVRPGEKVGLVGPSGAGKTTLAALLFRFYDCTAGGIYIDGQNTAEVTQESLRRQISLVPQDTMLFHRTLLENIRYGRRSASDDEVKEAARQAHCEEFIERLTDGYNTYVGERGVKLSGGERQRVAIARAILKNAPLLLLDEATSSLDSQVETLIQDALEKLMAGRTTIVIAHRLSTIMKMDRIVVLRQGQIQEVGSHYELLKKQGGLYKTLWELQAGGFLTV